MNLELVEKIAEAVLYEGYMLYPYRASAVKNRQRFNWGVLTPPSYSAAQRGTENWRMQTEVLVAGDENATIDLKIRFLHLREREIYQVDETTSELLPAESLQVDGQIFQTWQEAFEREANVSGVRLNDVIEQPERVKLSFPASDELESLCDKDKKIVGAIIRRQQSIEGEIEVQSAKLEIQNSEFAYKLTVRVSNTTAFENAGQKSRDEALAHSLASAHTILAVRAGGEFVSLLEPPEEFGEAAAACANIGTYPVLVGDNGARDCMLSSPIILYDYPQIAPESPGDLFDGAEIDEILTLRILTMTDEEKREMLSVDERARKILERSENLSPEQFMKMHGILREPRSLS
jgi:hydrogenase maturation protease